MMLKYLIKLLPTRPVFAHCDIPCGIYDPTPAQIAAHTVLRMTQLIQEAGNDVHKITRLTKVKEDHAEIVKHEVVVLWGDYFKAENSKNIPDLHDHIWQTLKLASKAKQEVDIEVASALLAHTQVLAEMFWRSKGLEPVRVKSGYPTEGEIVSHN